VRRIVAVGLALTLALAASTLAAAPARADDTASVAVAQQLYDEAKAAMGKEDYATACQKFAESNRLDPATGGTLLNLAVCHEKMGKIATAWSEFEEAAQLARHFERVDREQLANDHVEKLRPRVSFLALHVPDTMVAVAGITVAVDGTPLGQAAWGNIPLDPGQHTVTAAAPGRVPWTTQVTIGPSAERPVVEIPALEPATPTPTATPTATATATPTPTPTATATATATPTTTTAGEVSTDRSSRRTLGFLLGGVGVAGILVGSGFGIAALDLNSSSKHNCQPPTGSAAACGNDLTGQHALLDANISDVAFGVGVVGLAVATYFILTAPPKASRRAWVSPSLSGRGGMVGIGGAW
jgi:hypothetical protein